MITLTPTEWDRLRSELSQTYPRSVMLIRAVMRRELGFTVREHHQWNGYRYQSQVCLDFFDNRQETWFRIKYADFIWDGNSSTKT